MSKISNCDTHIDSSGIGQVGAGEHKNPSAMLTQVRETGWKGNSVVLLRQGLNTDALRVKPH